MKLSLTHFKIILLIAVNMKNLLEDQILNSKNPPE